MPSDLRTGLLTREEYLNGAVLTYNPVSTVIPASSVVFHTGFEDKITFKTFKLDEDSIDSEILTREQTEKKHFKSTVDTASFDVYLKGGKYIQSLRQGTANIQAFHNKVLRQYSILFDRLALAGDGKNNGILVSTDPNYINLASSEIPAKTNSGFNQVQALRELFGNIKSTINEKNGANNLILYYYGKKLGNLMDSITESTNAETKTLVKNVFANKNVKLVEVPELAIPTMKDDNGIVCVATDIVRLDVAMLPTITKDGVNEENEYYFANYAYGSSQATALEMGGIIKQPITFAT